MPGQVLLLVVALAAHFTVGLVFLDFSSASDQCTYYDLGVMAQFALELTSESYFSPINVSSHVNLTSGHPRGHLAQNKGSQVGVAIFLLVLGISYVLATFFLTVLVIGGFLWAPLDLFGFL